MYSKDSLDSEDSLNCDKEEELENGKDRYDEWCIWGVNHSCYATLYSRKSSPSNFGPQQTARINFENFDFFQINISALKLTPAKPNLLNSMQKILLYLPRQTKQFVMFYLINQRFKSKLRFEEFFSFAAI